MSPSILELPQLASSTSRILLSLATMTFMTLTMAWWFLQFLTTYTHTIGEEIREYFRDAWFHLTLDTSPAAMAERDQERRAQYPRPRFTKRQLLEKAERRQYSNEVREAELRVELFPPGGSYQNDAVMEQRLLEYLLDCDDEKKQVVAKQRRVLRSRVQREAKREAEELWLLEHLYYDHKEEEFGHSCVREDSMRLIL
ncbi:hypothetical protein F5X68DRAFT_246541 [Plectosphaerella plurivora]|uniref:Uncharacterized protein n=1 Tax=Plectosphaerella plurivora TaxID=936078 RepID=A0A9P8V505_9PEZI|nr:hypothetical protein F5X68DRAFT_246541 [Plectosphaerella plurivora]